MNIVILTGRLTKDPDEKMTQSGMAVTNFTVAVDKFTKNQDDTATFIPCTAFGKTGEFIGKYFGRGRKIVVQGKLDVSSYQDREGNRRTFTKVIVDRAEFADSHNNNNGGGQQQEQPMEGFAQGGGQVFDEDVPF